MRSPLCIVVFLAVSTASFAQTFTGYVQGEDGDSLPGASVIVTAGDGSTMAYCIAGEKGLYRLDVPQDGRAESVSVSFMGRQKKVFPFAELKEGMTVVLSESSFQIRETKVTERRIKSSGDTLTYSVAGFKEGQDRSIADVISKMPGLEVKSDGQIAYQGKEISKFYIEGLDLMGSSYGVASQNLPADKVSDVQVLENHQAVRSLRGISFSDQAALNIVLKEDAKAVWTGTADVGLGYGEDFLYDCRLMGMMFNKRFQTLMMYKNNDTGSRLGDEVLDIDALLSGRRENESGILSMMDVDVPDLDENRFTFNHSHLVAGNWLWKTGGDSELRLQCSGLMDRTDLQSYCATTYLTLADLPVITEEQRVANYTSEWKGELNYEYNGAKTYIRNNIKGYMDFDKSTGSMIYDGLSVDMSVRPRKRSLCENFSLSHTTAKGNVISVDSYTSYNYLPGQLLTVNGMTEMLNLGFLSSQNNVKYRLKVGGHYLNNEMGVNYDGQNIGVALDEDAERMNRYKLIRAYWTPSMSFLLDRHRIEVKLRVSYAHQIYRKEGSDHLWLDPSFSWDWKASAVSQLSADVKFTNSPMTGKAIYDTPIFTDYRTVTTNRGETDVRHILSASMAYKYGNPVSGWFFNVRPSYILSTGNILYESSLEDNIYSLTATDRDYDMQTLSLSARLSKSFSWARTVIGLGATHSLTNYELLLAGEVDRARMNLTIADLDYSLRPVKELSIAGKSGVDVYDQRNLTRADYSSGSTADWHHNLDFHVFPAEEWMVSVMNSLFHTNEEGVGVNYFLDLALSYRAKRWEISLTANNVVGTSQFERRILGNTVESYTITRLRPREFLVKFSIDL